MKTQIVNLINGSCLTIRNLEAEKYKLNPIGFYSGQPNTPANGGTPTDEREAVARLISEENPNDLHILANGVELTLTRHNSVSGKHWYWELEITASQYQTIIGDTPKWTNKDANNHYSLRIGANCVVEINAWSGKKGIYRILGEEFIKIL